MTFHTYTTSKATWPTLTYEKLKAAIDEIAGDGYPHVVADELMPKGWFALSYPTHALVVPPNGEAFRIDFGALTMIRPKDTP